MGLAAYLWLEGFRPLEVEWNNRRATWTYESSQGLDDHIRWYDENRSRVDPKEYFNALTQLRRASYEEGNGK